TSTTATSTATSATTAAATTTDRRRAAPSRAEVTPSSLPSAEQVRQSPQRTRSENFAALPEPMDLAEDPVGLKETLIEYLPFFSFGSLTETLPLAEALSLTFVDLLPYFTVTVPAGFASPATLTFTLTVARFLAFTDFAEAVTLGLPFATFSADDVLVPSRYPVRLEVTRTEILWPTSAVPSLRELFVAPLIALPPRSHW